MTCLNIFHTNAGKNIAGLRNIDFRSIICVHFHHATDTLGFTGSRVQNGVALFHGARVNSDKRQRTKSIVHNLKRECAKWLIHVNLRNFTGRLTLFVGQRLRINLSWTWQVIDDSIKY